MTNKFPAGTKVRHAKSDRTGIVKELDYEFIFKLSSVPVAWDDTPEKIEMVIPNILVEVKGEASGFW